MSEKDSINILKSAMNGALKLTPANYEILEKNIADCYLKLLLKIIYENQVYNYYEVLKLAETMTTNEIVFEFLTDLVKRILSDRDSYEFVDLPFVYSNLLEKHKLYVVKFLGDDGELFCKIGITKNSVEERFKNCPYHILQYRAVEFSSGVEARGFESYLLEQAIPFDYKYKPKKHMAGYSECYKIEIYNSISWEIQNMLDMQDVWMGQCEGAVFFQPPKKIEDDKNRVKVLLESMKELRDGEKKTKKKVK